VISINCLLCDKEFYDELTFDNLFYIDWLCPECKRHFMLINFESNCPVCGNIYPCCQSGKVSNRSLYLSNEKVMEMITLVKFRHDQELLKAFKNDVKKVIRQFYKGYTLVPVPLSKSREKERDFNQAMIIAKMSNQNICDCLSRLDDKKQSKKTLKERLTNPPKFELKYLPVCKKILIIDDIYTTGSTINSIADLFPNEYIVKALTLIRVAKK